MNEALEKEAEGNIKDVPKKMQDALKKVIELEEESNKLTKDGKMGGIARDTIQAFCDKV